MGGPNFFDGKFYWWDLLEKRACFGKERAEGWVRLLWSTIGSKCAMNSPFSSIMRSFTQIFQLPNWKNITFASYYYELKFQLINNHHEETDQIRVCCWGGQSYQVGWSCPLEQCCQRSAVSDSGHVWSWSQQWTEGCSHSPPAHWRSCSLCRSRIWRRFPARFIFRW